MPKSRVLGQLYPSFLFILLLSLAGLGWFAADTSERFSIQRMEDDLLDQASFLAEHMRAHLYDETLDASESVCTNLGRATDAQFTVVRPSGELICSSRQDAAPTLGELDRPEVKAALRGESAAVTRYNSALRKRVVYAATPVMREDQLQGVVYASRVLTEMEQALVAFRWQMAAIGLAIAAIAVALTIMASRRMRRAVHELAEASRRIAAGELDYRAETPPARELEGLAEAFNQMAAQLQQRIEAMIRQSNEQKAVIASMSEGVLAVDNEQRVISLNKASGELLGIDQVQAQGRSLQEVVRNADLRRFVTRALVRNEPIDDDVVLHGDHEGVFQARGSALHDAQGRPIGAVVVLNDVTDIRRLEHIRRDFVANVSHELKTPITSIKGFVETLLEGAMHNPEEAERFLKIVAKQADRLDAIIEDLLSLSRIEQGEESGAIALEPGSIKEVLDAAVYNCQSKAAERQITVQLDVDESLAANINGALLEQAVTNLLDNAIKYSEPGREVQIQGRRCNAEVVISVADQGGGIATEHLSRIFERFYRVDKARSRKLGGTGLGLAIVKHIVQAHGGRVTVKSTVGVGSTFTIYLPGV